MPKRYTFTNKWLADYKLNAFKHVVTNQTEELEIKVTDSPDLSLLQVIAYRKLRRHLYQKIESFLGCSFFSIESGFMNSTWRTDLLLFRLHSKVMLSLTAKSADYFLMEKKGDGYDYELRFKNSDELKKHRLVDALLKQLKHLLDEETFKQLTSIARNISLYSKDDVTGNISTFMMHR